MCQARDDARCGQLILNVTQIEILMGCGQTVSNIKMSQLCQARDDGRCGQVILNVAQIEILMGCGQTTINIEMTLRCVSWGLRFI